jgi:hypothetical protein
MEEKSYSAGNCVELKILDRYQKETYKLINNKEWCKGKNIQLTGIIYCF